MMGVARCKKERRRAHLRSLLCLVLAAPPSFANSISSQIVGYTSVGSDANIVGYQSFSSRRGMFAVGMSEVNGCSDGLKLSSIKPNPEVDGARLKFYDGYKWNEANYALCTDDAYHWLSNENFLLDDEVVPVGATIVYELPDGVENLSVAGQIGRIEDAVNMTSLEMVPKQEMEDEVRRVREALPKETVRTVVITNTTREIIKDKTIFTNLVVVTNTVIPDRFIVRFSDGHTQRAKWSWQFSKAIDPVSGVPMNLSCGDVAFEEDLEATLEERATIVQRRRFYDEQFPIVRREKKESIGEQLAQKSNDWIWDKAFAILERVIWFSLYPIGKWLWKRIKRLRKKKPNKPPTKRCAKGRRLRKKHHRS